MLPCIKGNLIALLLYLQVSSNIFAIFKIGKSKCLKNISSYVVFGSKYKCDFEVKKNANAFLSV